ncbi:MAG: hypothetical protein M1305_00070, partial [Candidatus Marsarchaeota archaeon]|nr:hypothetical protein [Candidatus Marsarchaeota archaeon]
WTTLQSFQRTRGVLKLMAKVIYRLWKDQNQDLMILPGSLPLYDGNSRNELTYYLAAGWDAVLDTDIDGERAETTALESKEPRFGAINAACRVARTIFLGSAPSSGGTQKGIRGLDRARILLGCLQPGQSSSTFSDALNRLADRLHYLNSSGDKAQDTTRFWFDTRANLRREMEDRKIRFDDKNEVRVKVADVLRKLTVGTDGIHVFTPHSDVPDDDALRYVFLSMDAYYSKQEARIATEEVLDFVRNNGSKPRYRGNRLIFVAPDHAALTRVRDCVRAALAWNSIVDDVNAGRLNIDRLQEQQAKKELKSAEDVLPRVARECYKWLLCPVQSTPTDRQPSVEAFALNTGGSSFVAELERVCRENELVISVWSPIHLRDTLRKLYWKDGRATICSMIFWEDTLRYLYLPRLKNRNTLEQAIITGASSSDFFGTAYGQTDGVFEGFKLGDANVQLDDTLLLIDPAVAKLYAEKLAEASKLNPEAVSGIVAPSPGIPSGNLPELPPAIGTNPAVSPKPAKAKSFYGSVEVSPSTAKMRFVQLADEIISILSSDPQAELKITVEIGADFPAGASDQIKRAVSENAKSLGFKVGTWE